MELLNKKTPINYEYQIKITHRELMEIRDAILSLARFRNIRPEDSLAGKIMEEIEEIVKN